MLLLLHLALVSGYSSDSRSRTWDVKASTRYHHHHHQPLHHRVHGPNTHFETGGSHDHPRWESSFNERMNWRNHPGRDPSPRGQPTSSRTHQPIPKEQRIQHPYEIYLHTPRNTPTHRDPNFPGNGRTDSSYDGNLSLDLRKPMTRATYTRTRHKERPVDNMLNINRGSFHQHRNIKARPGNLKTSHRTLDKQKPNLATNNFTDKSNSFTQKLKTNDQRSGVPDILVQNSRTTQQRKFRYVSDGGDGAISSGHYSDISRNNHFYRRPNAMTNSFVTTLDAQSTKLDNHQINPGRNSVQANFNKSGINRTNGGNNSEEMMIKPRLLLRKEEPPDLKFLESSSHHPYSLLYMHYLPPR